MLRTLSTIVALGILSVPAQSFARELPAYEGIANIVHAVKGYNENQVIADCVKGAIGDEYCRPSMAMWAMAYLSQKNYKKARYFLEYFYKFDERMFGGGPCNLTRINLKGNEYLFSYHAALFAVDVAEGKPHAKKSGLRAFLCDAHDISRGLHRNATAYKLNRNNFVSFVKKHYGAGSEYNAALYWDDVATNVSRTYDSLRKSTLWGKNYRKDTEDSVKLTQLYVNAAERCRGLGLSEVFCSFEDQWAAYRRKISSRQALDGGLE